MTQENLSNGFIAIYRAIRSHWIWQDERKLKWWLDILLECNHSDKKVLIGNSLVECRRGQSVHSLLEWSKRWRVDSSAVRRFFELLKQDNMIVTENLVKTTRITVCNYDSYQNMRHAGETQTTRKRISNDTLATTNNNGNHENHEKPQNKRAPAPDLNEVVEYFQNHGYSKDAANKAYEYYSSNDWKDSRGNPVKAWKQKMIAVWFKEENKIRSLQKQMVH